MSGKNIHKEPFEEATLAKLDIFEKYTQEWLPVFVSQDAFSTICIFDFFAGTGYDVNDIAGSPIRILSVIKQYAVLISDKRTNIRLYLNEYDSKKNPMLKAAVEQYLLENANVAKILTYEIYQSDFNDIYKELLPQIHAHPSLVFLDQNGVKFTTIENLLALEKTRQTDFLFFVSSSYVRRFGGGREFGNYLTIDVDELKKNPYKYIHIDVVKAITKQLPINTRLKLYPFTIKKGTNIYGLVFGAKNPLAVEKFLNVVWTKFPINGEANFDINEDITKPNHQFDMFAPDKKTKVDKFQELLEETIRQRKEVTNKFVYLFTLEHGHPIKHANEHIKELKGTGKLTYPTRVPKLSYKDAYREKEVVHITWLAK